MRMAAGDRVRELPRINRIKASVLTLFGAYWMFVVVILVAARETFDQGLKLGGNQRPAEIGVLLVLTALFGILSAGIIRNWRWTFWLILVAFLAGILRVPIVALELAGTVSYQGPTWFLVLQVVVGLVQFVIAMAMLAGYRKAGVWGDL
jgi:hypothetical protein